jgi:galactokinase
MDECHEFSLNKLEPLQNGGWRNYILGVIFEIQKLGKKVDPFHLVFGGDIPDGAGLSSSAALENAVVYGLNELNQLGLSKNGMILISQKAEHNFVGVNCGIMDQYASMFGQKDKALLLDCRSLTSVPFTLDLKDYQILLINTNVKHSLSDSAYNKRREVCEKVASLLKVKALRDVDKNDLMSIKEHISDEAYQMALYVTEENNRAIQAGKAMEEDDITRLGRLLYQSHAGLQRQYKVSCDELDFLVDMAKKNDKIAGARMMGGGFGGCTINFIKKDEVASFSKEIAAAYQKKFNRSCSFYEVALSEGTHVIPDQKYRLNSHKID